MRKQEANENVDVFVTALHALAEHCNYGTLHDELIRDRIVVGLADARLSERMQMDQDLNLEKAINMARQSEEIKKQQNTLRNDASSVVQMDAATVDRVFEGRKQREKPKFNKYRSDGAKSHFSSQSRHPHNSQCYKCGMWDVGKMVTFSVSVMQANTWTVLRRRRRMKVSSWAL